MVALGLTVTQVVEEYEDKVRRVGIYKRGTKNQKQER
jgi:hypothetical protein